MTVVRDEARTEHMGRCPSDETLAVWFDGKLSAADAEELEAHVAVCSRCAELAAAVAPLLDAAELDVTESGAVGAGVLDSADPRRPPSARVPMIRAWRPLVALAASVVVLVGIVAVWQMRRGDPARDVATLAALQGERRPTHGRLSGFPWAAPSVTYRSGSAAGDATRANLLATAADIARKYQASDDPREAHALGVALLVAGDVDTAVETLAAAAAARPADAAILNDASVAYLERAWARSDAAALEEARRLAERATRLQPDQGAGWFNLLRVAQLQNDVALEARANDGLARVEPPASPWRVEAPTP